MTPQGIAVITLLSVVALAVFAKGVLVFIGVVLVVGVIGLLAVHRFYPEVSRRLFGGDEK